MRIWLYGTVLSLAVIVIAGMYWYARIRNKEATSSDLNAELARYRTKGNSWRTKCEIANNFAASQTYLFERCARKLKDVEGNDRLAIGHFASAYYKRGPQQKEELIALLHSQDVKLVWGMLQLLCYTADLGPNGEWQLDKALGGSEMAHHIASVYQAHPKLAASVASTLGIYGPAAKGEVMTLLRIALSQNWAEVFQAKMALMQIDREGVYSQFDLGLLDEPLTDEQRIAIENYLALHGGE
jgi:hypothetical protein